MASSSFAAMAWPAGRVYTRALSLGQAVVRVEGVLVAGGEERRSLVDSRDLGARFFAVEPGVRVRTATSEKPKGGACSRCRRTAQHRRLRRWRPARRAAHHRPAVIVRSRARHSEYVARQRAASFRPRRPFASASPFVRRPKTGPSAAARPRPPAPALPWMTRGNPTRVPPRRRARPSSRLSQG